MAFSFSKIFKPKSIENPSALLAQIDYKEGTKFAENENAKVYIDIEELGGFPYLKTMLFGIDEIKIKKVGCTLSFTFENEELILTSDNTAIESNQINKTGIYYTPIDFELDESQAKKIQSNKALEIKYTFKKSVLNFKL